MNLGDNMTYEVRPEEGEQFALVGETEIVIKGIGHQPRKGNLVVTDRRIAFSGRLAIRSVVHAVAHLAGSGRVDMSIPYENIEFVRKPSTISGFHIEIGFKDLEDGKSKILRVKIIRWAKAEKAIHGADIGINAAHAMDALSGEIDFVPIVGDFISMGLRIAHWNAGRKAADEWIYTINKILEAKRNTYY